MKNIAGSLSPIAAAIAAVAADQLNYAIITDPRLSSFSRYVELIFESHFG